MLLVCVGLIAIQLSGCRPNADEASATKLDVGADPAGADPSLSGEWPNLNGPSRNNISTDPEIRRDWTAGPPTELWRIDVGTGYSSPIISDGKLILVHRVESVENPALSGQKQTPPHSLDESRERGSFVNQDGSGEESGEEVGWEMIQCFDATSGRSLWKFAFPATYKCAYDYSHGPYSTPVIADGKVIAVGQSGQVHCLGLNTGSLLWSRDLFADYQMVLGEWPVAAGGIVWGNAFIFNLGAVESNAGIIALDTADGTTLWANSSYGAGHASPVVLEQADRPLVLVATLEGLTAVDPEDGTVAWHFDHQRKKAETYNAVSPVVDRELAAIVTGPGPGMLVVKVDSSGAAQPVWHDRRLLDSQYTNLVCARGLVFGFTPMRQGGPQLRCVELSSGKLKWKWKAGLGRGMMVAAGSTIFILGEKGELCGIELSGRSPQELFRTAQPILKKPCYSSPAIAAQRLYLRNERHLVCLDISQTDAEQPLD